MSDMFEDVADRHLDLGLRAAAAHDPSRAERRLARRITARIEGREGLGSRRLMAAAVVLAGVGITFAVARSIGEGSGAADTGPATAADDGGLAARRFDEAAAIGVERAPELRWMVGGVSQPAVAPAVAVLRERVADMQDPASGRQDPVSVKIVPGPGATHADVVATLDALLAAGFAQVDIEGVALKALIPVFENGPDLAPARFAVPPAEQPFRGAAVWIDGEGRMFVRVPGASRDEGPMGPEELAVALARSMAVLENTPAGAPSAFDDFGEALLHGVGIGAGAGGGAGASGAFGGSGTAGPRPPAGGAGTGQGPAGGAGSAGPRGPARAGVTNPGGGAGGGESVGLRPGSDGQPQSSAHSNDRRRQLFFSLSRDQAARQDPSSTGSVEAGGSAGQAGGSAASAGPRPPASAGVGSAAGGGSNFEGVGVGGGGGGAMGGGSGTAGSGASAGATFGSSASAGGVSGGSDAIGLGGGSGSGGGGFGARSDGGAAVPLAVFVAIPGETSWAEAALPALRACAAAGFDRVHLAVRRDESSRMR